jgi:protein tyrosine phosphatase (PTP) superfamily phosphohydrolase (DUF442 family)
MAGEKNEEQDQPDQAVIHPIVSRARMRFSHTPVPAPEAAGQNDSRACADGMGSFTLWVDTSEELLWCQCEGKSSMRKGDPKRCTGSISRPWA